MSSTCMKVMHGPDVAAYDNNAKPVNINQIWGLIHIKSAACCRFATVWPPGSTLRLPVGTPPLVCQPLKNATHKTPKGKPKPCAQYNWAMNGSQVMQTGAANDAVKVHDAARHCYRQQQ